MDRRSIIKNAGIAGVLAAGAAPAVHAQAAIRWRLASSFPKSLDTIFGAAEVFAKKVGEMSGGKFTISTHAGGELIQRDTLVTAVFFDGFAIVGIAENSTNFNGRKPRLTVIIGEGVNLSAIKTEDGGACHSANH